VSDESEPESEGMSLEEFLRKVVGASVEAEIQAERDDPKLKQVHLAIHVAITAEYDALVERALMTDALRAQPDLTLATAGRGWALHQLAARLAGLLHKHSSGAPAAEYAAQKLEHDAACTRWAVRLGEIVERTVAVDQALGHLKDL
jgi:hypothetical protein